MDWILLMVAGPCSMTYLLLFAFSVRHSASYWFRDIISIRVTLNLDDFTILYLTNNPTFIFRSYLISNHHTRLSII